MEFQYGVLSFALSNSLLLKAFPFHIYSHLTKKGEIKMKSMNIFTSKKESKELIALPPAPIQDENGNITFELEGKVYSLNVNSEEERERVKEAVNSNSLAKYDWFEEVMGEKHWVLYNTEMYEVIHIYSVGSFLHYRESSALAPIIPINATSCFKMFEACRKLTTLDLSRFNTKNVVDMGSMFFECENLMSLNVSNFNTSKVTNMDYMFNDCCSLTTLNISNFGTSKVTSMIKMFANCERLKSLDLSNFDTSEVTDMYYMFSDCTKLINLNISSFNTSKVTNMEGMFRSCLKLTSFDISNFDTSKVTTMSHMFTNCYNVKQLDLSNFDTSNVFDMSAMFFNCFSLTQLDLSDFNTSIVEYMKCMFYQCKTLTTIYTSAAWKTNRILNTDDMFKECNSLPGFSPDKIGIKMAKSIEEGGYLTLKR